MNVCDNLPLGVTFWILTASQLFVEKCLPPIMLSKNGPFSLVITIFVTFHLQCPLPSPETILTAFFILHQICLGTLKQGLSICRSVHPSGNLVSFFSHYERFCWTMCHPQPLQVNLSQAIIGTSLIFGRCTKPIY